MIKILMCVIVLCLSMMLFAYDPFNPNPSSHDVWSAQNSAWNSEQSALNASVHGDDMGWQQHTEAAWRHRLNAEEMERRMQQNNHRQQTGWQCADVQLNEQPQSNAFLNNATKKQDGVIDRNDTHNNIVANERLPEISVPPIQSIAQAEYILTILLGSPDEMPIKCRWKDKVEKKRFFGRISRRDRQGRSAREFLEQAEGSGLSVDLRTGTPLIGSGPVSDVYQRYVRRVDDSWRKGSATWKALRDEQDELLRQMNSQYGDSRAGFFTRPNKDGGTDLFWRGYNYRGHFAKHPFLIATSSRRGLDIRDFSGPEGYLDPALRYNMLNERFAEFYELVMGKRSILSPTNIEQQALDLTDKLKEAWRIIRRGED